MKKFILSLLVICTFFISYRFAVSLNEHGCPTDAEWALVPWQDHTHSHSTDNMPNHSSTSGSHTHASSVKQWHGDNCIMSESTYEMLQMHETVENPVGKDFWYNPENWGDPPDHYDQQQELIETLTVQEIEVLPEESQEFLQTLTSEQLEFYPEETLEAAIPNLSRVVLPESIIKDTLAWLAENPDATPLEIVEYIQSHPDYVPPESVNEEMGEPESEPEVEVLPIELRVVGLTSEEIQQLPEVAQTFLESIPEPIIEVIDVIPSKEALLLEEGVLSKSFRLHIHTGIGLGVPTLKGEPYPNIFFDSDEPRNFFIENVQYLVLQQPVVTEYMLAVGGRGENAHPQWIELYNPHNGPVNLQNWLFKYVDKGKEESIRIDKFRIPAGGTAILASQQAQHRYGVDPEQVYVLNIPHVLKKGWAILDTEGNDIHRIGVAFRTGTAPNLANPSFLLGEKRQRISHSRYVSQVPMERFYYGKASDVGSPGFFQVPIPSAPSKPDMKLQTSWGALKK